ncbi:MAG: hypothetical protein ABR888_08505 [Thermoplasmata archaeon]|jgi:hypothetical protein
MVVYEDEDLIAAPRHILWRLLNDHLDDTKILTIHPLIQSQKTVSRTDSEIVVDRVIDVRRKPLKSRWKITHQPPERARWEILESEGPWTTGSYLDVRYEDVPGGTHLHARGDLSIRVLPFFLSQKRTVARVLNDVNTEDLSFIHRYRF